MGLGWGIVGFGWVAQDFVAPAIQAAGDRLVAVADPDPDAARAAAGRAAAAYPEAAALAADPAVEVIYVATPNHLHRAAVEAAARAGKPVLCEKPMAATLTDALAMAEAVRAAGILYGTAFDQRHHPAHVALRAAIAAGAIGTPTAIRIVYACWVGRHWAAACASGRENWRIDPAKAGGGALIDLSPHGLDLAEFLLGEPQASIQALTQSCVQDYAVDDGALLIGRTASGVLASLHVAYNCPEALPRRRLEVVGSTGMIVADRTMGQDPGGTLTLIEGRTGQSRALPVVDADASPFTRQIAAFGEAVRTGNPGPFSLERDLGTMRLIARAYRSAGVIRPDPFPKRRTGSASPNRDGDNPAECPPPGSKPPSDPPSPPTGRNREHQCRLFP